MSSSSSSVGKRDEYESELLRFLLRRIGSAGGSLPLQHITGHLSQLSYDVRCNIGTSKSDLLDFFERHSDTFCVKGGTVKIVDSITSNNEGYDSDTSSAEPQSLLPESIKNGKGVIIKIFSVFGFIKAKEPVKTMVYFNAKSYNNYESELTGSLYVGAMVYFNAIRKKVDDNKCKYSATKVWKVDESDKYSATKLWKVGESDMHSGAEIKNSRKNRGTGLYDPITLDSEGVIQKVFPNLGFIAVKGDETNTVFFHKNRLLKHDNIVDLTKVLTKGDSVEFTALRSTKQDAKARWEATKVWKKSGKMKEKSKTVQSDSVISDQSSMSKTDKESKNSVKEMIKNKRGKICPRSQGAVIKFGENELADGDASVYYISGCQVTDISWEFSEGDDVYFDAVKIKSAPGWKAVLVWVGEKPDIVLPTCLGDFSEFTDDETEDNLSSCMSYSSNSSIKSISVKSQCSSAKMRKVHTETTSRSSNFSDNRELKKKKAHESLDRCGSQSSLSSITSKSSQRSSKEKRENSSLKKSLNAENLSNWGDSPYPADNNYLNISKSDKFNGNIVRTLNNDKDVKALNEEVQRKLDHSSSENEEIKCENKVISESKTKEKETAIIKKFKCVEGKIVKVFSKFAEVKAKKSGNILSFFWNNFYRNGVSVEELELDDLKQVLKVGDIVYFNYFEIIDDSGQNWQKVSLAWKNSKPVNISELSPDDFIKQNNLSVSSSCKTVVDNVEEGHVISKKFLTAVEDLGPDNLVDKSLSESCSEDKSLASADFSTVSKLKNKTQLPVDYEMLSSAIIQILERNVFPSGSKVDLGFITEEIISVIFESHDTKKFDDKFCETSSLYENFVNESSNVICKDCGKSFVLNSTNNTNTKNSSIQTIITGEIIAQNIFTEC